MRVLISLIFYLISLGLVYYDTEFNYRWYSFGLWCISVLILCRFIFIKDIFSLNIQSSVVLKKYWPLLIILALSLSRFLYLESYPYTGTGDATRDGGITSLEIYSGNIKNIFGFTFSQGFLMTALLSLQYYFFESSLLSYRVAAALISVSDIALIYFFVRKFYGNRQAFFAALAAVCCTFHLYYARTETLIMLGSFLSSLMLYQNALLHEKISYKRLAGTGLVTGLACGFHASLWVMCLLSAIFAFYTVASVKNNFIKNVSLLSASVIIGYGPRVLFTLEFLKTYSGRAHQSSGNYLYTSGLQYLESLAMIFYTPTWNGHLTGFSFFPLYCGFFIIPGAIYLICRHRFIDSALLLVLFVVMFANGAVTDRPAVEYRLMPVLPVLFVMIGCGVTIITGLFSFNKLHGKILITTILGFFIFMQLNTLREFFTEEPASNPYKRSDIIYDYMYTDTIYLIRKNTEWNKEREVCVTTSRDTEDYFLRAHNIEYLNFLAPGIKLSHQYSDNLIKFEWYVSLKPCNQPSVNEQPQSYDYCDQPASYRCPPGSEKYRLLLIK